MLKFLTLPHLGPAESFCWKRQWIRIDLSPDLGVRRFSQVSLLNCRFQEKG